MLLGKAEGTSKHSWDMSLKYISLFVLVFQNACQVLLIRYSRTRDKKEYYLSTVAVFLTEVVKLIACFLVICVQENSIKKCLTMMYDQIVKQPMDTLKVCVPAIIYTIQNNLLYIAVSNLDAATFMVTYQLKILTTALFSVWMLRRPLSWAQWGSLLILFAGVSMVQLQEQAKSAATPSPAWHDLNFTSGFSLPPMTSSGGGRSTTSEDPDEKAKRQSPAAGLSAVITACMLSGFAGIYFEKILKGSSISVWMRNVQLAVLAVPIGYITMLAKDGHAVRERGMMYGFDELVWVIVLVYALGGLTVAVVIKYADNILKGFATSAAIVVSCVASVFLFDFTPTEMFISGTALVMLAIYVYSKYPYVHSSLSSSGSKV